MASKFKECRGKRLLQMCKNQQNKENYNNNCTEDVVMKQGIGISESTGTINKDMEPIAHCSYNFKENKLSAPNDMESFSEDDDDSVKDPNYCSSSNRSSSSSSSSSRSSSRSSLVQNINQSTRFNDPQVLGDQNIILLPIQQSAEKNKEEEHNIVPFPIQRFAQETKDEKGDQNIELPLQSAQQIEDQENDQNTDEKNEDEEVEQNIDLPHIQQPAQRRKDEEGEQNIEIPSQFPQENKDEEVRNNVVINEQENNSNVKKGKKRLARVDEWLSVKAKKLRNTGQSYVSRSKEKKTVSARAMKPPCGIKCKMQCSTKIENEDRMKIFTKYWELGDINLQRNFINNCTKEIVPVVRFTGKQKPRKYNNAYYFNVNNEQIRVCKKYFMATLDVNDRSVRTVFNKRELGFVELDKRGKHGHHKKIDESIKQSVRDHINSIPRIESHYIRKNTSREFIDGGKCIADLHEDYKQKCVEQGVPSVNYEMYAKIFNQEFNISFFIPKKDLCELCVSYENADESGKKKLRNKYITHLEEKELSRLEKDKEKANVSTDYIVAVYDLQAVLQTPKGDVSVFYYKSKLNNLNFTISELGSDHTECYLWHEGEANRGADEIGSCILDFIDKMMANYDGPGIEFVFFSDNCCGQQKNKFIFSMYTFALMKYPNIKSITHKYLITGHTQNEGDSVHSTIEKAIKKNLKSGPIYVPSQYAQIIKNAKKKGKPYHVNEMSFKDFFSMKNLSEDIGFNAKNLKTAELKVLKLIQGEANKVYYKHSYKDDTFKEAEITRKQITYQNIKIKRAYKCRPKIKDNKKKDLLNLVENNHIPNFYSSFYSQL